MCSVSTAFEPATRKINKTLALDLSLMLALTWRYEPSLFDHAFKVFVRLKVDLNDNNLWRKRDTQSLSYDISHDGREEWYSHGCFYELFTLPNTESNTFKGRFTTNVVLWPFLKTLIIYSTCRKYLCIYVLTLATRIKFWLARKMGFLLRPLALVPSLSLSSAQYNII